MSNKIKFIYFDVGGVAIRDFSATNKWEEFKDEIGITKAIDEAFENLYDEYESKINSSLHINDFYKILQSKLNIKPIKNYDCLVDGFIKRFDKNESLWPVIKEAKRNCKVGLLTNMWVDMLKEINNFNLLPKINWDVIIDSSKIGLQKPNIEIFEYATKKSGVKPNEILFVDNSQKNIDAAKKFGWEIYFYDSSDMEKSSNDLMKILNVNHLTFVQE